MIFFIYGTDEYRCRQKLNELVDGFIQKRDKAGLNVVKMEADSLNIDEFKQEALTTPFLGEKKMIIIKNVLKDKKTQAEALSFLKEKEDKIENILIFIDFLDPENKFKPAGELFRFLSQKRYAWESVWEINLLGSLAIEKWLISYLKNKGGLIAPQAAKIAVSLTGNDLYLLTNEADKLLAFKDGQRIEVADVETIIKAKYESNIFAFIDALANKNRALALKLWQNEMLSGSHPLYLLSMIQRQFKNLIKIKSALDSGRRADDSLAKSLGLHPYVTKKTAQQSKKFELSELKDIFSELVKIESKLKGGVRNQELPINLLIAKIGK